MNLTQALDYSRFAAHALAADASLAAWLNETVTAPFAWHEARDAIDAAVAADDDGALAARLRHVRRQLFIHTLARDLTGRAPLQEVVTEMTRLAEIALKSAVALHFEALAAIHGKPIGADTGTPQAMIIVAMGKLGGGELNVSSDVDLVFIYPEDGETDGARPLENREFFERLGRRVIAALGEVTEDGYVFRVDLRLRPYGESGPLAMSFPALEQYLITQGRAWERYAWLKARALTGERHDELTALITPFVYRKYLDYESTRACGTSTARSATRSVAAASPAISSSAPAAFGRSSSSSRRCRLSAADVSPSYAFGQRWQRSRRSAPARSFPTGRPRGCTMRTSSCAGSSTGCSTAMIGRPRSCRGNVTSGPRWLRRWASAMLEASSTGSSTTGAP